MTKQTQASTPKVVAFHTHPDNQAIICPFIPQGQTNFIPVVVHYTGGFGQNLNPTASVICFTVGTYRLMIGSRGFAQGATNVVKTKFYSTHNIGLNINLIDMPHGDDKDRKATNLPIFIQFAHQIKDFFAQNPDQTVLVNCGHGQSRSGTTVAAFLMLALNMPAQTAITLVESILTRRRVKGSISIQTQNPDGNYAKWLIDWEHDGKPDLSPKKRPQQNQFEAPIHPFFKRESERLKRRRINDEDSQSTSNRQNHNY